MSIEYLKTLSLNPFVMGKVFINFLEGYGNKVDLQLLFYVLPIILHKDSREKLSSAKSTSRLDTLFGNRQEYGENEEMKLSGKVNLSGFCERLEALKGITRQTIIILSNEEKIQLESQVALLKRDKYENYSGDLRETLKAAYYLGVVLRKVSQQYLDDFLGVNIKCKAS